VGGVPPDGRRAVPARPAVSGIKTRRSRPTLAAQVPGRPHGGIPPPTRHPEPPPAPRRLARQEDRARGAPGRRTTPALPPGQGRCTMAPVQQRAGPTGTRTADPSPTAARPGECATAGMCCRGRVDVHQHPGAWLVGRSLQDLCTPVGPGSPTLGGSGGLSRTGPAATDSPPRAHSDWRPGPPSPTGGPHPLTCQGQAVPPRPRTGGFAGGAVGVAAGQRWEVDRWQLPGRHHLGKRSRRSVAGVVSGPAAPDPSCHPPRPGPSGSAGQHRQRRGLGAAPGNDGLDRAVDQARGWARWSSAERGRGG